MRAFLCLLFVTPLTLLCDAPEVMPADFTIEYHLDGGMVNRRRTIRINSAGGTDEGREDGREFAGQWKSGTNADPAVLYKALRRISAFSLKSQNRGMVHDRGGHRIEYRISGHTATVSDAQSEFIVPGDQAAFNESVRLILEFADKAQGKPGALQPKGG